MSRNLPESEQIRQALQSLIDAHSRTNANKVERYWYPLSLATYDVDEVLAAVDSLCSFRTTMWNKTFEFETNFSALVSGRDCIMVNSGSSADLLIAFALVTPSHRELEAGDEVLVPAVTWPTQLWALKMAGLRLRFVDIDPGTLNLDLEDLEAKVTPATRALSLVHLMGNPCDMDRVLALCKRHELLLIEDCCEALGAQWRGQPVGTFGRSASFSFFFSHHITTMEGGMIAAADGETAELIRLLRAHGWGRNLRKPRGDAPPGLDPRYTFFNWGFNVRPTELQAAFGQVQLERLPKFQWLRLQNAKLLEDAIRAFPEFIAPMEVPEGADCSWFAMPIVVARSAPFTRADLIGHLERNGIETRPIVAGNVTRHPVADLFDDLRGWELPGADTVHDQGFYIGIHPRDRSEDITRVGETLEAFMRGL